MNTQSRRDETETLIDALSRSAAPRKEFKHELLARIQNDYNLPHSGSARWYKTRIIEFLKRSIPMFDVHAARTKLIAGAFSFVFLASLSGVITYSVWQNYERGRNYRAAVSGAEKQEILSKLIQNNPQDALQSSVTNERESLDLAYGTGAAPSIAPSPLLMPDERGYTYTYSKTTIAKGPAASRCALYSYIVPGTSENYSYYDANRSYSKSLSYDADGLLTRLDIYSHDGDASTSLVYGGGSYALKEIYKDSGMLRDIPLMVEPTTATPEAEPRSNTSVVMDLPPDTTVSDQTGEGSTSPGSSDEQAVTNAIDSMFGTDATVEKIIVNGVVNGYIVTTTSQNQCDYDVRALSSSKYSFGVMSNTPENNANAGQKLVRKTWYSADTNFIYKDEEYLESESAANLLSRNEYQIMNEDKTYAEIADNFTFNVDVEVKTVDRAALNPDPYADESTKDAFIQKLTTSLTTNKIQLITTALGEVKLRYMSLPDEYVKLLNAREFFPAGSKGDALYKNANAMPEFLARLEYGNEQVYKGVVEPSTQEKVAVDEPQSAYESISVTVYPTTYADNDLLGYGYGFDSEATSAPVTVTINGLAVVGKEYAYESTRLQAGQESVSGDGTSIVSPYPIETPTVSSVVVFEYAGKKYVVSLSVTPEHKTKALTFSAYNPDNSDELNSLLTLVRNSF